MSDLEAAKHMIAAAERDLHALRHMLDPGAFALEVFGFHAQQVVEKSLKAWLSLRGKEYPRAHSLRLLIAVLEQIEPDLTEAWNLVDLNAFAVQFRYEAFNLSEDSLNREEILLRVEQLYRRVEKLFREVSS